MARIRFIPAPVKTFRCIQDAPKDSQPFLELLPSNARFAVFAYLEYNKHGLIRLVARGKCWTSVRNEDESG